MRLIFVHWVYEDRGSAQDLYNYREVASQLGHEVIIYGPPELSSFHYSLEIRETDAIVFIFEWTTELQRGDQLDWLRLAARVPRSRRVILDCDGKYNDAIRVVGDYNHPDVAASKTWMEICDSLSDKIFQPTLHPLRPNVTPFFFTAAGLTKYSGSNARSRPRSAATRSSSTTGPARSAATSSPTPGTISPVSTT